MKFLLPLLLLVAIASAVVFKAPIKKHISTGSERIVMRSLVKKLAVQNRKHLSNRLIASHPKNMKFIVNRLAKGKDAVGDYYDNFYVMNLTLGTPAQTFTVGVDTGIADFWVIDKSCQDDYCDSTQSPFDGQTIKHHKYDRTMSSTSTVVGDFTIDFDEVMGDMISDVLDFGNGLTISGQSFGSASSTIYGPWPLDGLLGLAWPDQSQIYTGSNSPPFQSLLPSLDAPVFTVWLDRHIQIAEGQSGGQITFGGVDTDNCDSNILVYVPVGSQNTWNFQLDGYGFGSYTTKKAGTAAVDTGNSFLLGPDADVDRFYKLANSTYDDDQGLNTVDCNSTATLPDFTFTIGGVVFNVPAKEYVTDMQLGNNQCVFGLYYQYDFNFQTDWVLADSFMRTYCTIHDVGGSQVGFAKAFHKEV